MPTQPQVRATTLRLHTRAVRTSGCVRFVLYRARLSTYNRGIASSTDSYISLVGNMESALAPYAKHSFEPWSQRFVDGGELDKHYEDRWATSAGRDSLANRTPLQLERDRILYSAGLRKQAEKYHVLYSGQRRIVRNFATATMRTAQVSRAIARGLGLNEDFAEAIALGSKVGAAPFVHAAKEAVDAWLRATVRSLDEECVKRGDRRDTAGQLFGPDLELPGWLQGLGSDSIFEDVRRYIPWAAGKDVEPAYASGQESYWMLCTRPFTLEARPQPYVPETMFGIWRHSRHLTDAGRVFHHEMDLTASKVLKITGAHITHEARVGQYADDITWAIENLNDANSAALLNDRDSVYEELRRELTHTEIPDALSRAITENDSGALYTYFIRDFVRHSGDILTRLRSGGAETRQPLINGEASAVIGLSPDAESHLDQVIAFLRRVAFEEPRVRNRYDMLKEVSRQCVRLLYDGDREGLQRFVTDRAALELWPKARLNHAMALLDKDVHRAQLAVDIFADMADQEIYDFVGIQAL